jgi:hypothetical protein
MFPTSVLRGNEAGQGAAGYDRVGKAIREASARSGVPFSFLLSQAKIESGLDPSAKAPTSSATGLYQFIEQTWLGTVKAHGAENGLGWAANAIQRGEDGRFTVADGALRSTILGLRSQPEAAAAMAAALASDNRETLQNALGRPVEGVDLYLAHFLGADGAVQFLSAHDADPNGPAAALMPAAAAANRNIFFGADGAPRSFLQIREHFAGKFGAEGNAPVWRDLPTTSLAALTRSGAGAAVTPSPQFARLAYLMLAELGA